MRSMRHPQRRRHNGGTEMVEKQIDIDGQLVQFKASAAIPRIYRAKFRRDIFKDLMKLGKAIKKENGEEDLSNTDLEMFENVAYLMAKHADPSQPDTPEEWLDQFDTFSIYTVLPKLLELWHINISTDVESKKKLNQVAGK